MRAELAHPGEIPAISRLFLPSGFFCVFRQWLLSGRFDCALMDASSVVVSRERSPRGEGKALRRGGGDGCNDAWAHVKKSQL
jgi:hypothetical protein